MVMPPTSLASPKGLLVGTTTVWIHQLRVKLDRMLPVVYPLRASNGTAGFRAYGKLNQAWRCDTSSDLSAWTPLGTVTNSTGWLTFFDPRLTLPPIRFYRIAPPQ